MKIEKCITCCGRGGIGSSYGGITLSYRFCNNCDGKGFIEIPENEQEEEELQERWFNNY